MRKKYLDNIRWITVCIVAIYHVIYMYNGVQPFGVIGAFRKVQYQDAFQYLVYPWFMALLFVVSGMSGRYALEKHSHKEFIRKRTRKLLVPSTIGLFVFQWILGYYNMAISGAFADMSEGIPKEVPVVIKHIIQYMIMVMSGTGVLWYIQMLWIFSILLVCIRKIEKDSIYKMGGKANVIFLLVCTIFIYLAAQVFNTPVVIVYRFGIYGLSFFLGYFVLSHDEVIGRLTKFWCPFTVAAIILGITYTVVCFGENYAIEPAVNSVVACIYAWIAILAVLSFMKKWGDKESPFTKWMAEKSWGLYIFHYLPLAMTAYYLHKYIPGMPAVCCYFLVGISSIAGALLLWEVIKRIPVIRWCVLGIKKEKKHV